jgi:PAS domain-containing protein
LDPAGPRLVWLSASPHVAAFTGLAIGSVALLTSAFELAAFQDLLPGVGTEKLSVAASFILGGASLLMVIHGPAAAVWARLFAAGLLGLMAVTWIRLVVAEPGATTVESAPMGFHAALGFTFQGIALLLVTDKHPIRRRLGGQTALAVAFLGWAGLIVYTYSITLYPWDRISRMVATAFGVMVLGLGTAATDSINGPLRVLNSDGPGGALARYLAPFVVLAPFAGGLVHLAGLRFGWYEPSIGSAALTIASTIVFAFIVTTYSSWLDGSPRYGNSAGAVTHVHRAEDALRESSQNRTATALASLVVSVWEVDLATRAVVWTENVSPLLASSSGTIRTLDDILLRMHPDDRQDATAAIARAIAMNGAFDLESRMVLPDSTVRWMRSAGRVIVNQPAGIGRLIGVTLT